MLSAKDLQNQILSYMLFNLRSMNLMSVEDFHKLVFCLLNDQTKEINLDSTTNKHWSDYYDRFEIMMEKISKCATNLEKLYINCVYGELYPPPLVNVTRPMLHLQSFSCHDWLWSDQDLEMLAQMMPNLVELVVI